MNPSSNDPGPPPAAGTSRQVKIGSSVRTRRAVVIQVDHDCKSNVCMSSSDETCSSTAVEKEDDREETSPVPQPDVIKEHKDSALPSSNFGFEENKAATLKETVKQERTNTLLQYVQVEQLSKSYDDNGADDDEEEEECDDAEKYSARACGLLPKFCYKGSFCLLNSIRAKKVGVKRAGGQQRRSSHCKGSVFQLDDEREGLLVSACSQGDELLANKRWIKVSSKLNQHTYQNDFAKKDVSHGIHSRKCNNTGPFGYGMVGKDGEDYWAIKPCRRSPLDSSPASEKTLYVDSLNAASADSGSTGSFYSLVDDDSPVTRSFENCSTKDALQKGAERAIPEKSFCNKGSSGSVLNCKNNLKRNVSDKVQLGLKKMNATSFSRPLVPPPSLESPSESWLSRTLPSLESRTRISQPFLGIACQRKKQVLVASSVNRNEFSKAKHYKPQDQQIKFVEVVLTN